MTWVSISFGAAPGCDDGDDRRREVDVRRVVHLHPGERDQAGEHQPDEQDDREDRVADAPGRDVAEIHGLTAFLSGFSALPRASDSPSGPGLRNGPAESTTASLPDRPVGDRHAVVVDGADLDVAALDLVLAVDDVDVIALVVAQHRALREQRRGGRAGRDPRLGEAARAGSPAS